MSWQQRDYAPSGRGGHGGGGGAHYHGSGMHAISVTTIIIIANIAIHFLVYSTNQQVGGRILNFGVMHTEAVMHGQIWRLFTATYLHASFNHIFFNMLGLYFFGPALERVWGPRQFLLVYTLGGVLGNALLGLAGVVGFINPELPGLGASGSVLSLLGAAAVLFPNAQVYVYFLFPIRIRTFVLIYCAWFVWNVIQKGANYGGDLCHIGGMAFGLWWAYSGGWSLSGKHRTSVSSNSILGSLFGRRSRGQTGPGAWSQRMQQRRDDEKLLDELLRKVKDHGVDSLTDRDKARLAEATHRRRAEEENLRRLDHE